MNMGGNTKSFRPCISINWNIGTRAFFFLQNQRNEQKQPRLIDNDTKSNRYARINRKSEGEDDK